MSGSRLGRGRGGRLAVYGGCGVVIILLVFLYRAATSEMARLRELHIQCVHQHESLAAQLQVIFEYKVRLEKSLAEEKSSNAMVKQELQQRASREKSLRDKDSMEAMQRFKSLQQSYKILQTEHRDLEEECKKQEAHAYEEKNRLESMQESVIKRIVENKDKIISEKENTLERFKNKYFDLETEKETLEEKYKDLIKSTGNTDSTIEHLKKEVFQLRTKVEETKKQCKSTLAETNLVNPKESHQSNDQNLTGNAVIDPTQQEEEQQQQQQKHVQEQEQQEQQQQQQQQAQQQQQQQNMQEVVISSSSIKTTISSSSSSSSPMKLETSTKLNNIDSVSSNKVMKTSSKVKIPPGVLPILMIMDQNVEKIDKEKKINNKREGKKNDVTGQNYITLKKKNIIPEVNSKEKENQIDKDKDKNNDNDKDNNNNIDNNDNIDLPYKILSAKKYDDDENVDGRRQNGNWFKVKPGVQEFGEEPNPIDRLAGLESIVGRQFDTGDEQYVGADFEAHAQKVDDLRLAEGEEEEDEDDPEDII